MGVNRTTGSRGEDIKIKKNIDYTTAALLVVATCFILLGSILCFFSSSYFLDSGYGFVYDFMGMHLLGIGLIISISPLCYTVFARHVLKKAKPQAVA